MVTNGKFKISEDATIRNWAAKITRTKKPNDEMWCDVLLIVGFGLERGINSKCGQRVRIFEICFVLRLQSLSKEAMS